MISVCMASYNGAKYIREQLESILCQLSKNDEVIISDNESTDDTLEIVRAIDDIRIKIYTFPKTNKKHRHSSAHYIVTANFENALSMAKGDYIFLADQDDIWAADKVKKTMPYIEKGCFVMSNYSYIDSNDKVIMPLVYKHSPIGKSMIYNLVRQPFHGCCLAFPKSLLHRALPFPKNLIMHDNWLGLLAQKNDYPIVFLNEPLTLYRRHDNNVSPMRSRNSLIFKIAYRLKILYQLLKRG